MLPETVLPLLAAVGGALPIYAVTRCLHDRAWAEYKDRARSCPDPDADRLHAERQAYLLLRDAWQPVPGTALHWSLGLLQDDVERRLGTLPPARPDPPRTPSATSRGAPGRGVDAAALPTLDPRLTERGHLS